MRFQAIYRHKWSSDLGKSENSELQEFAMAEWLAELTRCQINPALIYPAIDLCKRHPEFKSWPPTVGEFIDLCYRIAGVPGNDESFQLALAKNFSHPIVDIAYKKVGSWAFQNDTEKTLKKKFKAAYNEAYEQYKLDCAAAANQKMQKLLENNSNECKRI